MAWRAFRHLLSAVTALVVVAAAGLAGTARAGTQAVPCPITAPASDTLRSALRTAQVITPLRVETWNMQGSTAQGECLWALQVRPLARTNHVVALQEAGAPPASADNSLTNRWVRHGFTIEEYLWESGTRRRPETYYLYWMRTDTSSGPAGRVNLALVVPEAHRAVDVAVAWDPAPNRGPVRPALGIVPNGVDTWVFTVHAPPSRRPEAAAAAAGTARASFRPSNAPSRARVGHGSPQVTGTASPATGRPPPGHGRSRPPPAADAAAHQDAGTAPRTSP